jgi:hypothetical protein
MVRRGQLKIKNAKLKMGAAGEVQSSIRRRWEAMARQEGAKTRSGPAQTPKQRPQKAQEAQTFNHGWTLKGTDFS